MSSNNLSRVREAREVLREKSLEIVNEYLDTARMAKAAGDYMSAYKALQWLIDHIPADAEGLRVVDKSQDTKNPQEDGKQDAPRIQIGIALGGIKPKAIAAKAKVIDAE